MVGLFAHAVGPPRIRGPGAAVLLDANVRASGKSLLADIVSLIAVGTEAQRFANPECDEECRKRITAVMLENTPLLLIDNVAGSLGCPSLDAALTGTIWKDRELGKNRNVEGPLRTVWSASGNNTVLEADTARRVAHIRLESPEENPELRENFRHQHVKQFVAANRSVLLQAALTLLRAWFVAGQPRVHLPSWGSFEGWSNVIRQAVVWVGLPDPGETRTELREQADREAGALSSLLDGLDEADEDRTGLLSSEIIAKLDKYPDRFSRLRNALYEICAAPNGKLSVRSVGNKLKHLRGRVVNGRCLDERKLRANRKAWVVREAEAADSTAVGGYSGESGYLFSDPLRVRNNNICNTRIGESDEQTNPANQTNQPESNPEQAASSGDGFEEYSFEGGW